MKSKSIVIILLIAVGALLLFWGMNKGKPISAPPISESSATTTSTNEVQSGKIDEHLTIDNTLKDVNFCGKIYKAKQVIIDNVDVVRRIAELVDGDLPQLNKINKDQICQLAETVRDPSINKENIIKVSNVGIESYLKDDVYTLSLENPNTNSQHIGDFQVDVAKGEISIVLQGYAGASIIPIGKLK